MFSLFYDFIKRSLNDLPLQTYKKENKYLEAMVRHERARHDPAYEFAKWLGGDPEEIMLWWHRKPVK
jgi:hypothetical protein